MKAHAIILLIFLAQFSEGQIIISGDTCSNTPNHNYSYANYTLGPHSWGYSIFRNFGDEVFYKESNYSYIRVTDIHFINDSTGFISEIEGGVFKSETFGTSWNFFSFQGDWNWTDDSYNAMYFLSKETGYFACYDSFDTLSLYKLTQGNAKELLRISYDSVSQNHTLTDSINIADYYCGDLNHLLFTYYIQDDSIKIDLQFFIISSTGFEDAYVPEIEVFPNPSSDLMIIKGASPSSEYSIYNIDGTLLKTTLLNSSNTLSISDLASGMYLLEIKTDRLIMRKKIVRR
jgi:hypothetical protein